MKSRYWVWEPGNSKVDSVSVSSKKPSHWAIHISTRHGCTRTQREIGKALRDTGMDREEIFLTTKIWRSHLGHADVFTQFEECLDDLQMDYVDLLLIHHPSDSVPVAETFEAFHKLHEAGSVKSIGISNFSIAQVEGGV